MNIVVLTTASRPDRMLAFWGRWPGKTVPVRVHITRSAHRDAMREIWAGLREDTLVLEDDVLLRPGWGGRVLAATDALPQHWDLLYLGGQHALPPQPCTDGLLRCAGTHRTHAILVRHRAVPRLLALTDRAPDGREHLDAELSRHVEAQRLHAYALQPWVAGQAAGWSDIARRDEPERWWHWQEQP